MKKLIVLAAFIVFGSLAFSQTQEENKKAIQSIQSELKNTSNKETIKSKTKELRIRQALDQAYKANDKSKVNEKMIELNGVLNSPKSSKSTRGNDYNTSRTNGNRKKSK